MKTASKYNSGEARADFRPVCIPSFRSRLPPRTAPDSNAGAVSSPILRPTASATCLPSAIRKLLLAASQNTTRNRQSQIENAVKKFLGEQDGHSRGKLPETETKPRAAAMAAVPSPIPPTSRVNRRCGDRQVAQRRARERGRRMVTSRKATLPSSRALCANRTSASASNSACATPWFPHSSSPTLRQFVAKGA